MVTEDPEADQQLEYSIKAESLLIGEQEETEFDYSEVGESLKFNLFVSLVKICVFYISFLYRITHVHERQTNVMTL